MSNDEKYLATIRQALEICKHYKPKFGQGSKSGFSLKTFQQLYQSDPFYTWFGLNSPLVYAAHKAAGGITSVYRQIGIGVQEVFRLILQDTLGQTKEESRWCYSVPTTQGKSRMLSLDGRITLPTVRVPDRFQSLADWIRKAKKQVGLIGKAAKDLEGVVFECRQGYKSKDAKRQNADVANAANAYARNYLPCMMLFSLQIDSDIAERYVRAQWLMLTGSLEGTSLDSTYIFFREVLNYDLANFFKRNSRTIRKDVENVLKELLR
jgi:hypothetical protein